MVTVTWEGRVQLPGTLKADTLIVLDKHTSAASVLVTMDTHSHSHNKQGALGLSCQDGLALGWVNQGQLGLQLEESELCKLNVAIMV